VTWLIEAFANLKLTRFRGHLTTFTGIYVATHAEAIFSRAAGAVGATGSIGTINEGIVARV
jgi:hypothetical protein